MTGFGRVIVVAMLLAGLGIAAVRAQTVLGDPRDAAKIFASNCSTCHKTPRGLAKSGFVASFLRQHYTTGPEMSAAMAAYLVAAGSAPESKKGSAAADAAAKSKGKKGEQLAAHPQAENADSVQQRTLRGKQRQEAKAAHEEAAPATAHTTPAPLPAAEDSRQTAVLNTASATAAPAPAPPAAEPPMQLNIPMPVLPEGPPEDLVQSFFSSSPVP